MPENRGFSYQNEPFYFTLALANECLSDNYAILTYHTGSVEVIGSSPIRSTSKKQPLRISDGNSTLFFAFGKKSGNSRTIPLLALLPLP